MQLLKKPERSEENESENPKEKAKKPEKLTKEDRLAGSGDHKRRHNIEHKEDRGRRLVTRHFSWRVLFRRLKFSLLFQLISILIPT